ncbi:unnamed protein product [Closterium sp. Naga37s-1]|nr:unnamed protein product [Closterium sp. Naga37s-1]
MEDTDDNLPAFGMNLISSSAGKALSFPRHSPSSSATSAVDASGTENGSGADNRVGICGPGFTGAANRRAVNSVAENSANSPHHVRIGCSARSAFHLVAPSLQITPPRHIGSAPSIAACDLPSPLTADRPSTFTTDRPSPFTADRPSSVSHARKVCPSSSSSANSSLDHKADNEEHYEEDGPCSLRLSLAPPLVDASPTPPTSQRSSPVSPGFECQAAREADCALRLSIFPAPPQRTSAPSLTRPCLALPTASQVRMAPWLNVGEKRPVVRGLSLRFAGASTVAGPTAVASSEIPAAADGSQPSDALQLLDSEPVKCGKRDLAALDGDSFRACGGEKAGGASPNKKPKHCWRPEKWRRKSNVQTFSAFPSLALPLPFLFSALSAFLLFPPFPSVPLLRLLCTPSAFSPTAAFPWAELHVRADGRQAMRCALCLRWCADEPTPFTRDGAVDLQRSTLRTHGKSRCHKKAVEREAMAARAHGQPSLLASATAATAPPAPPAAAAPAPASSGAAVAPSFAAPLALSAGASLTLPGALLTCS